MRILGFIIAFCSLNLPFAKAVTIDITAEVVSDNLGVPISSGVLWLVASTQGNAFPEIDPGYYSQGDYIGSTGSLILYSTNELFGDGAAQFSLENTPFFGDWDTGNAIALYWFPGMVGDEITVGQYYGFFTSAVPVNGGEAWITPSESATVSLNLLTTNAGEFFEPGTTPPEAAQANLQVVPEPSVYAVLLGGVALLVALRRRRTV